MRVRRSRYSSSSSSSSSFLLSLLLLFSSQFRLRYFASSLKLKDRCYAEFLAFIPPVVTRRQPFPPSLSREIRGFHYHWYREIQLCARPATQLTRSPYFRHIAYASPLRIREDLSEGVYSHRTDCIWHKDLNRTWRRTYAPK